MRAWAFVFSEQTTVITFHKRLSQFIKIKIFVKKIKLRKIMKQVTGLFADKS